MLSCDRRKVNPSKHSHTFAHFWLSARYKNRPEIVSKTASLLQALKSGTKNEIFPISGRLGFQTGSNMGPQNWPKIVEIGFESICFASGRIDRARAVRGALSTPRSGAFRKFRQLWEGGSRDFSMKKSVLVFFRQKPFLSGISR